MSFVVDDTIAAIASARGPAARSIIRISGPNTLETLLGCFHSERNWKRATAAAVFRGTIECNDGAQVPTQLYFWPSERSYTRQPSAELHMPGSVPLAEAVLSRVCSAGARLARPGEFTMRAFLAGRIDLTQAEAVLGVIDARNQRALGSALEQLAGGLSGELHHVRDQLLDLLADVEAGLDFVEEDISFVSAEQIQTRLAEAIRITSNLLDQMNRRNVSTDLPQAVLLGLPNAGKSRLFNALCGDQQAIVSELSGTTRDYIVGELRTDTDVAICRLVDTAGVADGDTQIAALSSQSVTEAQQQRANIVILCFDATQPMCGKAEKLMASTERQPRICVSTKSDLNPEPAVDGGICVSAMTGDGLNLLQKEIVARLGEIQDEESQVVASTAARCRQALAEARDSIRRASELVESSAGDELLAIELRVALQQLGEIVGAIYTDDVLDRIFSRFCIGK